MSKLPTRADLLAAKLPHVDITVPELGEGVSVRVQQMSVNTRSTYLDRIRLARMAMNAYEGDQDAPEDERKGLEKPEELDKGILAIIVSLVDEEGNRLFTEADMPLFNEWSSNAVTRIYEAVIELNNYHRLASDAVAIEKKG